MTVSQHLGAAEYKTRHKILTNIWVQDFKPSHLALDVTFNRDLYCQNIKIQNFSHQTRKLLSPLRLSCCKYGKELSGSGYCETVFFRFPVAQPVPIWTPKVSSIGPAQYLDGRQLGNSWCYSHRLGPWCWLESGWPAIGGCLVLVSVSGNEKSKLYHQS